MDNNQKVAGKTRTVKAISLPVNVVSNIKQLLFSLPYGQVHGLVQQIDQQCQPMFQTVNEYVAEVNELGKQLAATESVVDSLKARLNDPNDNLADLLGEPASIPKKAS